MKQTVKRLLALVLALAMSLPAFAMADEQEVYALPAEAPVEEITYSLDDDTDLGDPDAEVHEAELQWADETAEADEPPIESLVRVSLTVLPAEAAVAIFAPDADAPIEDQQPIEPQMGADWLLAPGEYVYSAWAEGYLSADRVAFEVPEQAELFSLEILLEKAEDTGEAETASPVLDDTEPASPEGEIISETTGEQAEEPPEGSGEEAAQEQTGEFADGFVEETADEQTAEEAVGTVIEEDAEELAEGLTILYEEDPEAEETGLVIAEEGMEEAGQEESSADIVFTKTCVVDDVAVTVTAEAGAFPEDAVLSVEKVPVHRQRAVDAAVQEAREDDVNVAVSYTFDIKMLDAEGNALQPAEGMNVSVSFAVAYAADANLTSNVYHIIEDESGELTADRLDAVSDAIRQTVEAETDGFSLYTIEFTYNTLQYVLRGTESVPLDEVLAQVGLTGEVEGASVSDPALFSASDETGEWVLTSHQPFDTAEWLKVVTDGVEYEIIVTYEELEADNFFESWEDLQAAIDDAEEPVILALDSDLCAEDEDGIPLEIPAGKRITLDLNGCALLRDLTEPEPDGCVIVVYGDLTLIDQAEGGVITGGMNSNDGGGIYVAAGGRLMLDGAVIEGNISSGKGGGVYAAGAFTMKRGEIEGNEAGDMGGGVYFENAFAMNGGSLRDNLPEDVYLNKPMTVSGKVKVSDAYLPDGSAEYRFLVAGALGNASIRVEAPESAVGDDGLRVTQGLNGRGTLDNFKMSKSGEHDVTLNDAGEVVIRKYAVVTLFAGDGTNASAQERVLGGMEYTLPNGEAYFTLPGGRPFTAWLMEDGTLKQAGEKISVTESVSATAQWALTWPGLQAMIDDAEWGDTLRLPSGLVREAGDGTAYLTIPADKKITLDLAGYALDGAGIGDKAVIYVEAGGDLTLTDSTGGGKITGGSAGGVVVNGGSFTLQGGEITGNSSNALGGGVLVNGGSFTLLGDGAIGGNTAQNGGGVGIVDGSFAMKQGRILDNTAQTGGGVAVTGGKLILSGGRIGGNEAASGGGVSVHNGAGFAMKGGSISGNSATMNGGGLLLEKGASVELGEGIIEKNSAEKQGGGIYADQLHFTVEGVSVTENKASFGGGVADNAGVFTLKSGSLSRNTATSQGGGLYVVKSAAFLSGGSVTGNTAQYGGGAFIADGALSMPQNVILNNTAGQGGAGVAFSNMKPQLCGVACVRGNTVNGAEADYWLQDGAVFAVAEQLDADYKVYVSVEMSDGETRVIASGEKLSRENFISADPAYAPSRDMDGNIMLGTPLTVHFSAGAGTGTMADDIATRGGAYTLPGAGELTAPSGTELQGWKIVKDGYWDTETKGVGANLPIDVEMLDDGALYLEAQWGSGTLYVDENGTTRTVGLAKSLAGLQSNNEVTLSAGWYLADGATFDNRVTVKGDVNIIIDIAHTTTMNAGILVPAGSSLSVWGMGGWETSSGKLVAFGGETSNAGIGGTTQATPGTFELHSGVVEATGGANAAGIGGGDGVYGGIVRIHGGKLTARGGQSGAGIGGGMSASQGGMVSIYGGTVNAYGGDDAAGIGGGKYSGTVMGDQYGGNGAQVVIAGATVYAQGGQNGAGIGGGYCGSGGRVSIGAGSAVTAIAGRNSYQSSTSEQPQAIGRGYAARSGMVDGSITLTDKCYVEAGADAASATRYNSDREAACRQNYAKVIPTGTAPTVFPINAKDVDSELTAIAITRANDLNKTVNEAAYQERIAVKITPEGQYNHYDGIEITYTYHGETLTLTDYEVKITGEQALVTFDMPRGDVYVKPIIRTDTFKVTVNVVSGNGTANASVDGTTVTEAPVGRSIHIHCAPGGENWFLDVQQENTQDKSTYQPYATYEDGGNTVVLTTPAVGGDRNVRTFTMPAADVTVNLTFRERVFYYDKDGKRQFRYYFNTLTGDESEIKASGKAGSWYYVGQSLTYSSRVKLSSEINLILGEGVTLKFKKGLRVPYSSGGKLYLYEEVKDGNSQLVADASGQDKCAGIGGNDGEQGGTVCIVGGTVTANGGNKGAGIGGGNHGGLYEYIQYGGNVTASGGKYGAGVGGGEGYDGSEEEGIKGEVHIYGGTLTANGGGYAAGIGGGQSMHQGKRVTVEGGNVYATGGRDGAGIGGGEEFDPWTSRQVGGNGGDVYVSGGYVKAVGGGGDGAAGIGGGQDGKGGKFVMSGGRVYAKGGDNAAGIGGQDNVGGDVDISGGRVEAYGGKTGAGIGGAQDHRCGTIRISGGSVYAKGGKNAAGIGGGGEGEGGSITISGGDVYAKGGKNAAAIGGGDEGYVDSIAISRGNVRAYGDAKAIGGGDDADEDGSLSLTGTVYANNDSNPVSAGDRVSACRNNWYVYIVNCSEHELDMDTIFSGESKIDPYGTSYCYVTGYCKSCNSITAKGVDHVYENYVPMAFDEGKRQYYVDGQTVDRYEYHRLVGTCKYCGVATDTKAEKHRFEDVRCRDCGFIHPDCKVILIPLDRENYENIEYSVTYGSAFELPDFPWPAPTGSVFKGWHTRAGLDQPHTWITILDYTTVWPMFEHKHDGVTFQPWMKTDSLPYREGCYYLLNDVELASTWKAPYGVHLCLAGHTVTCKSGSAISVDSRGFGINNLTVCDCAGTGEIYTDSSEDPSVTVDESGSFTLKGGIIRGGRRAVYVYSWSRFNMEGGVIDGAPLELRLGSEVYMTGGRIINNTGDGAVLVAAEFHMQGGEITGNKTGVRVLGHGWFTMTGGEIHDNTNTSGPVGVYIEPYGTFDLQNGSIHDNSGSTAVAVGGYFNMTGGEIADNNLSLYGAVMSDYQWAQAKLSGGRIAGNRNTYGNGGGVFIGQSTRSFTMTGGEITGNSAAKSGGGVYVSSGAAFTMTGEMYIAEGGSHEMSRPVIVGNTAGTGGGGVYVDFSAGFTASQSPTVIDNTVNGAANNVYLMENRRISASGLTPFNHTRIGITTAAVPTKAAPVTITDDYAEAGQYEDHCVFISDNPDYYVLEADGKAVLVVNEKVNIKFDANGGGGSMPDVQWGLYDPFTLPDCDFVPLRNYHFIGWQVSDLPDIYYVGDTITLTGDTTISAVWEYKHEHDGITFIPWTSSDSLPTQSGSYYLTRDVTMKKVWNIASGTAINLCLNEHNVIYSLGGAINHVGSKATLNLYDESGKGRFETSHLAVEEGATLGLDGATLKTYYVTVLKNGVFNLRSGKVDGGRVMLYFATMNMSGGAVVNYKYNDPGVYLEESTLNMSGGEIAYNSAGGVGGSGGRVNMTGGDIHDNEKFGVKARQFNMSGGSIRNNGGTDAVLISSGIVGSGFEMSGGEITGNNGGIRTTTSSAKITLSGSARITDNGQNGVSRNVYLADGVRLTVGSALNSDALFGITTQSMPIKWQPVVITQGLNGKGVADNFFADNEDYDVAINADGEAVVQITIDALLVFDANGGSGEMSDVRLKPGTKYTLPECGFEGLSAFAGWQIGADAENLRQPGETITVDTDLSIKAVWEKPFPGFRTHSLLLTGEIGINFFMELPAIEGVDYSNSYMEFTVQSKNGATTRDYYDADDRDVNGRGYYGFTVNVNAIQLAAPIRAVFHYGDGKTVEQTYSVKDYIVAYEAVADRFDASTTALVHAIADYGHYVQPILAQTNGWTIGKDYAEMDVYYAKNLDIAAAAQAVSGYEAKYKTDYPHIFEPATYTLNLLSKTEMRMLMTGLTSGYMLEFQSNTFKPEYTLDGKEVKYEREELPKWRFRYYFTIPSIPAHRLADSHTLVIQERYGPVYATYTFSPMAYVNSLIRRSDTASKQAAAAIYYYYKAVRDYRAAHGY